MSSAFFPIYHDSENTPFYDIPIGTVLYRGESSINEDTYELSANTNYPIFFGFDKENIETNYGITYQFTTKQEIRCIAIDLLDESSPFVKKSPPDIQSILLSNYGLVTKERVSESDKDKVLANYVCQLGLDGYATNLMETRFDTFHAEIALCNPAKKINMIGHRVTTYEKAAQLKREQTLIRDQKEQNLRRKKRRSNMFVDDEESPPSSPMRYITPTSFILPPSSPTRGGSKKKKTNHLRRVKRKSLKNKNKNKK